MPRVLPVPDKHLFRRREISGILNRVSTRCTQLVLSDPHLTKSLEIDPRDLLRQAMLHLPRFDNLSNIQDHTLDKELFRLLRILAEDRTHSSIRTRLPSDSSVSLDSLRFGRVAPEIARDALAFHHYLRSPRSVENAWGLFADRVSRDVPLCLLTLSDFDLNVYSELICHQFGDINVGVISRVLGARDIPRNSISYLMACMYGQLREHSDIRLLLTYINHNLGFTGASVKAAGWSLLATEEKPYYLYLDQEYRTERWMLDHYGDTRFSQLLKQPQLSSRLARSKTSLAPLGMYCFDLWDNETARKYLHHTMMQPAFPHY